MNLISRPDNTQRVFLSEDAIDIPEILESQYSYIMESIAHENFILKYDKCNLFKELVYDGKVVGFCSYDFSREFMTAALSNIYVLPQFRGNGIFISELVSTMEGHNKPSIMEPTRFVVELLIKYGFASKINDDIVASALEFIVPGNHVISNVDYDNEELSTHFYDLSICASIHILDVNCGNIAYSSPLNYDIIHYDSIRSVDDEYIHELIEFFKNNEVDLMNAILGLEENLPIKRYTLEEVIGDEDSFSEYIESLIDDGHVTRSRALEIKRQIKEEYDAGMILNESLMIRLAYLFNDNSFPSITSHDEICPYCSMPIDDHDRFCHFCGINLEYDPDEVENDLLKYAHPSEGEFKEDIRFIAYKFLRLIEEKIELEYSIYTIENNYSIHWDVLKDFLEKNNYFADGRITYDGYEFLDNHPLNFWEMYEMDIVDYTDFENYFYDHMDLTPREICLNYLKKFDDDEFILEILEKINNN